MKSCILFFFAVLLSIGSTAAAFSLRPQLPQAHHITSFSSLDMATYSIDDSWDNALKFRANDIEHQVFRKGDLSNRGVVIMHEMPGMSPECIRLAEEVVAAGFRVYLPLFFGKPGKTNIPGNLMRICIRREFTMLKNNSSGPITDWVRALCDFAYEECGGRGVGAIGMCLTGGFALALMVKPTHVVAPVLSQPSLPGVLIPFRKGNVEKRRSFGVCAQAMADTKEWAVAQKEENPDFTLPVFRFAEDKVCPKERMDSLRDSLGADMIVPDEGDNGRISTISKDQRKAGKIPRTQTHSVLTGYAGSCDESDPTTLARQQVIAYLRKQLVD